MNDRNRGVRRRIVGLWVISHYIIYIPSWCM